MKTTAHMIEVKPGNVATYFVTFFHNGKPAASCYVSRANGVDLLPTHNLSALGIADAVKAMDREDRRNTRGER